MVARAAGRAGAARGAAPHLRARADGRAGRGGREARDVERPGRLGEGCARPVPRPGHPPGRLAARGAQGCGPGRARARPPRGARRARAHRRPRRLHPHAHRRARVGRSAASGRLGEGVLVGSVSMGLGLELDLVVLCGLAEGSFPGTVRDDSLLPDREREAAGRRAPAAAPPDRPAAPRAPRHPGRCRAPGAHASPAVTCAAASERVPSRWVLDVAAELAGRADVGRAPLRGRRAVGHPHRLVRRRTAQPRVPGHRAGAPAPGRALAGCRPARARRRRPRHRCGHGHRGRGRRCRGARAASPGSTATSPGWPSRRRSTRAARPPASSAGRSAPSPTAMQNLLRIEPIENPEEQLEITAARQGEPGPRGRSSSSCSRSSPVAPISPRRPAGTRTRARRHRRGGVRPLRGRRADRPAHLLASRAGQDHRRAAPVPRRRRLLSRRSARATRSPPRCRSARGGHPPVPFPLPDGRSVPMRGNADRVDLGDDGTIHVADYKTGKPYDEIPPDDPSVRRHAAAARHLRPGGAPGAGPTRRRGAGRLLVRHAARAVQARGLRDHATRSLERGGFEHRPDRGRHRGGRLRAPARTPGLPVPHRRATFCDPDGLGTTELWRQWVRKIDDPGARPATSS